MMQGTKKKQTHLKNENVLEALGSVPAQVASNTVVEFANIGSDIISSLLGSTPSSGELKPNQTIEFDQVHSQEKPVLQPAHTESLHKPNVSLIEMETKQQLDEIRAQLKSLISSLKHLNQEVQTAVSTEVVNPGIYHINFYEQLRTFVMVLKQQVEDSRTWLASFSTRKKKLGYWGMFKKHGTNFGLSNERSLATSAG